MEKHRDIDNSWLIKEFKATIDLQFLIFTDALSYRYFKSLEDCDFLYGFVM